MISPILSIVKFNKENKQPKIEIKKHEENDSK